MKLSCAALAVLIAFVTFFAVSAMVAAILLAVNEVGFEAHPECAMWVPSVSKDVDLCAYSDRKESMVLISTKS
jgi:hypothetical protein